MYVFPEKYRMLKLVPKIINFNESVNIFKNEMVTKTSVYLNSHSIDRFSDEINQIFKK